MQTNNIKNNSISKDDYFDLKDFLFLCLNKWKWFVLSLTVTIGIAIVYLLITPPVYTRSAELLIKEDSKGHSLAGGMEQTFSNMGIFKTNTNVKNEMISLQSPALMYEVVKRLNLDMNYYTDGTFHKNLVYGVSLPLSVELPDILENQSSSFTIEKQGSKIRLSEFLTYDANGDKIESSDVLTCKLNELIKTPVGKMKITATPYCNMKKNIKIYVTRTPLHNITDGCISKLSVSLREENTSVISLSYDDINTQRAEDVLNTLISVYNENWVKDKNQIAVSTSMFISERLGVIEQELGHVDQNISSYKSQNLVPDLKAASDLYMNQSSNAAMQIQALNNQMYMARYIRGYVTDAKNKNQLLPANSGIENSNIEQQISEYNNKQLQRNALVANSSEKNPLVIDLDQALVSMRTAIIRSIDNQMETLNAQIRGFQQTQQQSTSKIAANPNQAKYLLSVERQQKVKEALYLFLLQKREENELSQAFTAYNTRLITPPRGNFVPTFPVRNKILLIAFGFAIALPALIFFYGHIHNTKLRGRKDLENLSIPFIGEIPMFLHRKKGFMKKTALPVREVIVKPDSRNIINEAFRVLRTNLDFMTDKELKSNLITITSFNPGSGKTFITMNTAMSLVIKGKKVLIIDGDMRHASLSTYINKPKMGLSNYLSGQKGIEEVICKYKNNDLLNIIPVGTIPPNPTELLLSDRLKVLLDYASENYDFVFIDCPPIELVADTQIIEKLTNRTLFVVRAGLMERSMLKNLQALYDENKYKNMNIILNGTESAGGRYGYQYGYHYGYGSDYHYGSNDEDKDN